MIRQSLKMFWKNFIYVFVAMGIFYLFLLLIIFGLFHVISNALAQTLVDLSKLINSSIENSAASINDFLAYALGKIDWDGDLIEALKQILNSDWLLETLRGFFETLNASTVGFDEEMKTIVSDFSLELIIGISFSSIILFFGTSLASFATKFLIRRNNAKRNLKKFILANTLVPILQALILYLFLFIFSWLKLYGIIVNVALIILVGYLSLMASWLIYHDKTLKLKEVLNFKNVLQHFAIIGIIVLINISVGIVLYFINFVLDILLMIPLIIYSLSIINVHTDAYVCSLLKNKEGLA